MTMEEFEHALGTRGLYTRARLIFSLEGRLKVVGRIRSRGVAFLHGVECRFEDALCILDAIEVAA